jgi:hypothetical protein
MEMDTQKTQIKEKKMKNQMIMWAVKMFIDKLDPEDLKKWMDMGLDIIEDKVADSPNKTDDMIVLPLCRLVREALSIPDNDYGLEPIED